MSERCPVCSGSGLVPPGFYGRTGDTWSTSVTIPETCRACKGTGVYDSELAAAKKEAAEAQDDKWIAAMHAEDLLPHSDGTRNSIESYVKWFEGLCTSGLESDLARERAAVLLAAEQVCLECKAREERAYDNEKDSQALKDRHGHASQVYGMAALRIRALSTDDSRAALDALVAEKVKASWDAATYHGTVYTQAQLDSIVAERVAAAEEAAFLKCCADHGIEVKTELVGTGALARAIEAATKELREALAMLVTRYKATLAGRPVKDADEVLEWCDGLARKALGTEERP